MIKKFSDIFIRFSKELKDINFQDFDYVGIRDLNMSEKGKNIVLFKADAEFKTDKENLESHVSKKLDEEMKNVYDIEEAMNDIVDSWIKKFETKFSTSISKNFIQFVSTNYDGVVVKEVNMLKNKDYSPSFDFEKAYFTISFIAKGVQA